jgi:hypothetical protein
MKRGGKAIASTVAANGAQTTADVAQILEDKYHIMEIFFEENVETIGDSVVQSMADAFDLLVDTGSPPDRIFPQEGQADIQVAFNKFIDTQAMDGVQPGVPTKAALNGVQTRFKTRKGPPRPSFRDTGLYEQSFRAWVD